MTMTNKYRVEAPVRAFSGDSVGVTFTKGTGFVDDSTKEGRAAIEYFRRHGYGVSPSDGLTDEERAQEIVTGVMGQREPIVTDGPFDPSKYGVEDVLTHLDEADLEEATRVLDAEADAKKPRVGITGKRDEILAAKQAPADTTEGAGA